MAHTIRFKFTPTITLLKVAFQDKIMLKCSRVEQSFSELIVNANKIYLKYNSEEHRELYLIIFQFHPAMASACCFCYALLHYLSIVFAR